MDSCLKIGEFNKMVLGLCFFHSVVLERHNYGSLGWSDFYDFNDSDLESSKAFLLILLNEQE